MATVLSIRTPDGEESVLAIVGEHFAEPDAETIDAEYTTGDLWALPGLADAHAHLTMTKPSDIAGLTDEIMIRNLATTAWAHVENGVLLILDKGAGNDLSLLTLDHDTDLRPIAEVAGALIHPPGGYMDGFGAEVEPEDLVEFVRTRASTRGGWVKIVADWPRRGIGPVTNYPLDVLAEAVRTVHQAGARVAVHTMADGASDAVAAGVDSIEHGPFLSHDDLRVLADRGGAWVPTVGNMEHVRDMLGAGSSGGKLFSRGLDRMRSNLPLAEQLGVTVLAGTDLALPHGDVALEAQLLRDYGLTDAAATAAASTAAYAYTGRTGTLAAGQPASVVFFEENPHERVEALRNPALIIHRGRAVEKRR